jgi:K+-transporting ATPase KdpF subunit
MRRPDEGRHLHCPDGGFLPDLVALRPSLRADIGAAMDLEHGIGLILSILLLAYLGYALLNPERF